MSHASTLKISHFKIRHVGGSFFCLPALRASQSLLGRHVGPECPEVLRSHYEEGPGKNLPFSVENKWRLLAMMTVYFGSGFAAPFFIVRHQLLKK
ncbi:cytochrome c oxidase subunit 7C, mitochondrial-like [Cricetulus griseus]|uniref:Cytochrome c oxidase subunit 7C, mitochondrial n=1 Tax=Cricetulus griseus TaxID=10029 RepID=A0A9J7K7V0_CRIGR|nr:cytochrome c oxidase subunit 7C, mitochondrial-like [Cricetulus griseus]XP_035310443.1 cytochrome c oxidase subunit 7C, mitochondrial-like [Cricetulus griseus]